MPNQHVTTREVQIMVKEKGWYFIAYSMVRSDQKLIEYVNL